MPSSASTPTVVRWRLSADVIGDVGAYSIYPWTAALEPVQVVSFLPGPYRIEHYRGRVRGVVTSKAPTGPYRGVGRPISTFVMERLIDMAAAKLGIDPKEFRLRNLVERRSFPTRSLPASSGINPASRSVSTPPAGPSATTCCAKSRKDARRWPLVRHRHRELCRVDRHRLAHFGCARHADQHRHGNRHHPHRFDRCGYGSLRGRLAWARTGNDFGADCRRASRRALRGRPDCAGRQCRGAGGTGTYASRSLVLAGGAATLAAQAVREKVFNAASHLLEAAPADLTAENGKVSVAGTDRSLTFREVARAVYSEMGRLPVEAREELAATKTYDPVFGTTSSACHIATVEIDPQTYEVRVEHFVAAEDCGRLVNPLIVDGQVHGGVAQGIGAALYEEVIYDDQGQIHTASLVDYPVPSACEIPPMKVVHLEMESPTTLGGFAAWAKAAPLVRQRQSPTQSLTRSRRSASTSTNFRSRRSACSA